MREATLNIAGMSCGHCVKAVEGALEKLEGVEVNEVGIGTASIRFDEEKIDSGAIAAAIEEEGYSVEE